MKRWAITAAAAAVAVSITTPALADHQPPCQDGPMSTKSATRTAGLGHEPNRGALTIGDGKAGSATIYVDDRDYLSDQVEDTHQGNGTWIYLENNGRDYLQTGGTAPVDVLAATTVFDPDTDYCDTSGGGSPDMLIF